VSNDHKAIAALIVTKLHTAGTELISRGEIKMSGSGWLIQHRAIAHHLIEYLLDRDAKRLQLLLFHPNDNGLHTDQRHKAKATTSRFADCLDERARCLAIDPLRTVHH